jgi:VWFA-related protein
MRLGPMAFVLLLASPSWCEQGEPQAPKRPTLLVPATTEVVRVDVVVTDKGGRARRDLTREDFVVLEDGQPQPITQFQAFAPSLLPGTANAKAEPPKTDDVPDATDPADSPPRYVVLAVDDIHIDIANLTRLRKTLDRFIEREVPEEDFVALVTTSGKPSQEFTRDRDAVRRVIGRLTVQNLRPSQIDVPHIDEYQAERILLGDPEALRVAVEEIDARRRSPDAAEEARSVARQVMAEAVANSRITLETLDNVVRAMANLRGRKVVILLSDGFLTGLQLQGSAAFDMRRITDAGARSGVIVYGLDSRGLQGSSQHMTASSRTPMMPSTSGTREQMARASEVAIHDAMNALSADTGGFLVTSTNDLSGGLKKIMKDTETYYVLAYEPTNERRDGAFRKIEVRLNGMRDIRIRHRKGYFAPDARRAERVPPPPGPHPPSRPGGAPPPAHDRVRAAIRETLGTPAPADGLRVSLSADFVSLEAGEWQVVVSGLVDLRGVPFTRAGNRRVATFDVGSAVFSEEGAEVTGLAPERVALDFTDEAYGRALETGLEYQKAAPVKPGRYRVSIAAREESSGRIGSATQWVEVPDLAEGKFSLSSLFLMKEDGSAMGMTPSAEALPALRGTQARPVYRQQENLHLNFFAYNHGGESRGFVTRVEIRRGGVPLAVSRPEALREAQSGEPQVVHTRKIPLKAFEPGDYEVHIVVTDERQNVVATRRAAFTIEFPGSPW